MSTFPSRKRTLFALLSTRRQRTSHQRRRKRPTSNIERPALNDPGRGVSQPLQGALKKCVLERRLKCAGDSLTDAKLRSDFELSGAMDFHVYPAALRQRRTHRLERQLRRIAIPAEMSVHNPLDFSGYQFLNHACCGCVRQVPVPRLDSMVYRP